MNRFVVVALTLGALLAPLAAQADPISINVLSAIYSVGTTVQNKVDGGGPVILTDDGSSAVSQSRSELASSGAVINASASAAWLAVSEDISQGSNDFFARASADFDLTFSPLIDGYAPLDIDVTRSGEYGSGLVTLFDVTSQQVVWRVAFGSDFGGTDLGPVLVDEGGIQSFPAWSGLFALPTALNAADVYELHLTASTLNPGSRTFSSVQVSGLVAVPEPSSLTLLGIGLVTLGTLRGRLRRNDGKP